MRFILLSIVLLNSLAFGQFTPSIGFQLGAVDAGIREFVMRGSVYNAENETYDFYYIPNTLGPMFGDVHLRGYGRALSVENKFRLGYSLQIGIQQFRGEGRFVYNSSSTNDPDSIINEYDNFKFKTDYSTAYFKHYLDFHWNLKDDLKWTNSVALGLKALARAKARDVLDASIIDNDRPVIMTLSYETQFTEKGEHFDLGYFFHLDFWGLPLFNEDEFYDPRLKFKDLNFVGIGFRVLPHNKLKESIPSPTH